MEAQEYEARAALARKARTAVEARFPSRIFERDAIVAELVFSWVLAHPEVAEAATAPVVNGERSDEALDMWRDVDQILDQVLEAFPQPSLADNAAGWMNQPPGWLAGDKTKDPSLSLGGLARGAAAYVHSTWASSAYLETWLLRQMIFAEAFAFGREMQIPPPAKQTWWDLGKAAVVLVIGIGAALSVANDHGPGAGVLAFVAWLALLHLLQRDKREAAARINTIFAGMLSTYDVAMRDPMYPEEVARHLELAEREGTVWPHGLRPVLQRMLERRRPWSA